MDADKEKLAEEGIKTLQKEFFILGKTRVKAWQAWLMIGILAGVVAGSVFIANRSGEVELSKAVEQTQEGILRRGESLQPQYVRGSAIVKLKSTLFASREIFKDFAPLTEAENNLRTANKLTSLKKIVKGHFEGKAATRIKQYGIDLLYAAELPEEIAQEDALAQLKRDPRVEYAEPNYIVKTFQTPPSLPNDPLFPQLWGLHNTGQTGGATDADIDAPEAWGIMNASNVIVGVIDTGVDYAHEDLLPNMWKNPGEVGGDGIDNDQNGFIDDVYGWDFANNDNDPMDDFGHGTHVAGTIGAAGTNSVGVVGVNWQAKIAAIKFLNAGGSGTIENAVKAVQYANLMGFPVTSNSWGGGGFSQALYDAIAATGQNGYLFVAAAGNSGANSDQFLMDPAAFDLPNIISVAATDHNDAKAGFSNYGLQSVDVGAPGVNILSSVPKSGCALCDPTGYRPLSGTSMATPHVSGAVALVWSKFPAFTYMQVKDRILGTVDPLPVLEGKTVSGGRMNLNNLFETDTTPPARVTTLKSVNPLMHSSVILEWQAVGDDGLFGNASRYDVRFSTSPISAGNFESATQAKNLPKPGSSGMKERFKITGLNPATLYYFALKVYDNLGNVSSLSNVTQAKTLTASVAFFDDMEPKAAPVVWSVEGSDGKGGSALWHVSERRAAPSPTHSWYYGQESTGDYDTGARNFGSITAPDIQLGNILGAELSFEHYLMTENLSPYDTARAQVSKDGGQTWTTVWQKTSTNGTWQKEFVDISAFDFSSVKIRFHFDTRDFILNKFEGWYIDNVTIVGLKSVNKSPTAKIGGPYSGAEDQAITFDGSGSVDPEGKPLTYKWDFGDGETLVGMTPSVAHAYVAGGKYTATLVVNDGTFDSAPSKTTVQITEVNDPPVASISTGRAYVGFPFSFDGSDSYDFDDPITEYLWNFDDGTVERGNVVNHVYNAPGWYSVTLTITAGTQTATKETHVPVAIYDMFSRPNSTTLGNGWSEAAGDFKILGGTLQGTESKGEYLAVLPAIKEGTDASAEFALAGGSIKIGVVLRYQDQKNYYAFYLASQAKTLNIVKFENGNETILKSVPVVLPQEGVFFRIGARAVGSTLTLELNGLKRAGTNPSSAQQGTGSSLLEVVSVTDTTFTSGLPGILVRTSSTKPFLIDNFKSLVSSEEKR